MSTASVDVGRRSARAPGISLARRLVIAFVVFGILVAAVIATGVVAYVNQNQQRHLVIDDVDQARVTAQRLLGDYIDEETGVRGYQLSHDTAFLQPYDQAISSVKTDTKTLVSLLAHEGIAENAQLTAVEKAGAIWVAKVALPSVAATRVGNLQYQTSSALLRGKSFFDQLRKKFSILDQTLLAQTQKSIAQVDHDQSVVVAIMVIAAAMLLIAAGVTWWALRSWVPRPLASVGAAARLVADGDLGHTVTLVGPPDLVDLAADVDAMRGRVVDEVRSVEQARAELESTIVELERSNVELEQFAYVASHDLQEPLRKVVSFCQLLERRYKGQLDERADEYIAFAVDGASRMQVLINDLLAFSRVGRTTGSFEEVDLEKAYGQALRNLQSAIEDADADVSATPLPTVAGDPSLLTALIQNLVGNAVKFHGDAAPVVRIEAHRVGDEWTFAITDNGIGIEPRFVERVFLIFQRLHGRDLYAGTGIGLALCKKIVEFHGGRIWIDTEYASGTRICWTLPASGQV